MIAEEEREKYIEVKKDAFKKYSQISANNGKPGMNKPLQFIINEGNNSNLIRRVMESRLAVYNPTQQSDTESLTGGGTSTTNLNANFTTWEETTSTNLFNFKWKPFSYGLNYEKLSKFGFKQLVNHIEGHQSLTTKDELFFNLKTYCERKQSNVFDIMPFTMAVDFNSANSQSMFEHICNVLDLFEVNKNLPTQQLNRLLQKL